MTIGSKEKNLAKEGKLPRTHPLVDQTFFRADRKVARGEGTYYPWKEVADDHGGGPRWETSATKELDRRYRDIGDKRPAEGSAYVTTKFVEGWELAPAPEGIAEQSDKIQSRKAKYGNCPDCGYYLSKKSSCCPSGRMLVCMECAYTRTYEGEL